MTRANNAFGVPGRIAALRAAKSRFNRVVGRSELGVMRLPVTKTDSCLPARLSLGAATPVYYNRR
jgi:hypothetical protein